MTRFRSRYDRLWRRRRRSLRWRLLNVILAIGALCLILVGIRLYSHAHFAPKQIANIPSATARPSVQLPKDAIAHPDTLTEWWYYNGLIAAGKRRYGFHYVFFHRSGVVGHTIAHVALSDFTNQEHWTDQRRAGGFLYTESADGFELALANWIIKAAAGHDQLQVDTDRFAFDLSLQPGKPAALHDGGWLDYGDKGSSYYYSRTRMPVAGFLRIDDEWLEVHGQAWFDHQWGDFEANQMQWEWFALQLDSGVDLMLYDIKTDQEQSVQNLATLIDNNQQITLRPDQFTITGQRGWLSPDTHIQYRLDWRISIPEFGYDLQLRPLIDSAEFDARATTFNAYWEGAVSISGTHTGAGFVEIGGKRLPEKASQSLEERSFEPVIP